MRPLFRLAYGADADLYFRFRRRAPTMTEEEYRQAYEISYQHRMLRGTDLNRACLDRIPEEIVGQNVLEAGSGQGVLAGRLGTRFQVTGCDLHIADHVRDENPDVTFVEANLEKLPFADGAFETVVSTHVLEHVLDIDTAMAELRRVASRRLVIVVPRERPYKFAFNLHLTFFPYAFSVLRILGHTDYPGRVEDLGGDWLYVEELA